MAKTMPPREVESSFVSTMPVRPTASWNATAWARPFWPVVASSTNSVSGIAPGSRRSITRRIFASSSIRLDLVCSRPAVSMMTTSACASNRRIEGVEHDGGRIGAGRMGDDVHAGPRRPDPELVGSRGAERVGGGEHDAPARGRLARRKLADGGRLAGAVHADDQDDRRWLAGQAVGTSVQAGSRGRRSAASSRRTAATAPSSASRRPRPLDDRFGERWTDVAGNQALLDLAPRLGGDARTAEEARERGT